MRMVVPVNILGLPSCAVPVGCDDGLPQGVQLIGARFREDLLLDAPQAVEDRAPLLSPIQPRVAVGV
jgi:amidase